MGELLGEDERLVGNFLTDVSQSVGEGLEFGAVGVHSHVTLRGVAELGVERDGTTLLVVAEEVGDGIPNLLCAIASEGDEEELTPLSIVRVFEIKGDWDVCFD